MDNNKVQRRVRCPFRCVGESKTQQHFKPDVNINNIMAKYRRTGVIDLSMIKTQKPAYMDCSKVDDFRKVCNYVAEVNNVFFRLPADVRRQLGNDPAQMLAVIDEDPDLAVELGLMPDESPAEPVIAKQPEGSEQSVDDRVEANVGS